MSENLRGVFLTHTVLQIKNWRALLHIRVADASFWLTRWQHSTAARTDDMAAILKLWRHIKNPTESVDAYLREKHSCQISPRSDLKRQSLGIFFKDCRPNNNKNKMNSDMR